MLDALDKSERDKQQRQQEEKKVREEVDRQNRIKRFRERQHSLNDKLKSQLNTLKSEYKFTSNKSANKVQKAIANKILKKIQAKEMNRSNVTLKDEMISRKSNKVDIIDVMKNSTLPKGVIIKDLLKFGYDTKKIPSNIVLPRRTLECYY
jgi:sugar-specific transcriptional regulator TrmB